MAVAQQVNPSGSKRSGLKVVGGLIVGTVMVAAVVFGVSNGQSGRGVAAKAFVPSLVSEEWAAPRVTSSTFGVDIQSGEDEAMAAPRILSEPAQPSSPSRASDRWWASDEEAMTAGRTLVN